MKPSDLSKLIEYLKVKFHTVDLHEESLVNHSLLQMAQESGDEETLNCITEMLVVCSRAYHKCLDKLESKLDGLEGELTPENLEEIATMASLLEDSDDPELQKKANLLDQILLTLGDFSTQRAAFKAAEDKKLDDLREKYRTQAIEKNYKEPKEILDKRMGAEQALKDIQKAFKVYRPLETPLSTRTCPEHPGAPMSRVGDYTYQCDMDKKIYDFRAGYTSLKGNVVPGGDVALQSKLETTGPDHVAFDTREERQNRNSQ